ncbi:MAG: Rieske 2Fe-2S domain-containing protein [Alphaproteobacteria bacterium]|nr:Rieske 2Fe-2S domain-containing protein [Alphaproteobacteria bacterium]
MSIETREWQFLIAASDLEPSDVTPVRFQGMALAVYDGKEGIYVSQGRCTHGAANLCDGYFNGTHIECPLHQGLFDLKTGCAVAAPAMKALQMFDARIREGAVEILI